MLPVRDLVVMAAAAGMAEETEAEGVVPVAVPDETVAKKETVAMVRTAMSWQRRSSISTAPRR